MKNLWLIRHGHALNFTSTAHDQDRLLSEEGVNEVSALKRFLAQRNVVPDLIKSSSAARTVSTARILAGLTEYGEKSIQVLPELYLASTQALWAVISQTDDAVQTLVIVAHNPGLEDLVTQCAGRLVGLGTSAAVHLTFDVDSWLGVTSETLQQIDVMDPLQVAKS
ncbi:SixA phosphatase family protein [Orrella sp. 11846]|uniref:SixA phosphatase family protein n=1 Tax=Orrella sp. 11846 TaxID=3409913 RepID=UPI003B5C4933